MVREQQSSTEDVYYQAAHINGPTFYVQGGSPCSAYIWKLRAP
jgi:hypothetical protein